MADTHKPPVALVFDQPRLATPGSVALVLGDAGSAAPAPVVPGVHLVFDQPRVPTPGPVALVFGETGGDTPAPGVPDATLASSARVSGLRARVTVRVGALLGAAGQVSGLRAQVAIRTGALLGGTGQVSGLRVRVALQVGALLDGSTKVSGLRLQVALQSGAVANSSARVSGLRLQASARYDVDVQRPTVAQRAGLWQGARWQDAATAMAQQGATPAPTSLASDWQRATSAAAPVLHPLPQVLVPAVQQVQPRHQDAHGLHDASGFAHQNATPVPLARLGNFEAARPVPRATGFKHQDGDRRQRTSRTPSHQNARPVRRPQHARHQVARWSVWSWAARQQNAVVPPPGRWSPPPPPPPDPCYLPALPAALVFAGSYTPGLPAPLVFICERHGPTPPGPQPGETIVVPIQRVYIVQNNITLTRVDSGAPLHALSFSCSVDVGSWTWQWSATLHESAADHLARNSDGTPPEVLATINGQDLRLCIERIQLQEQFLPQRRYSVSGRGRSAILSSPWSPILQHGGQQAERTAQQLATEVLTINNVPIGWSVDWQIADWVVPAGVWTQQGSYIDALTDIAGSVGAYLQPHATERIVRVLPKYPDAPWRWHTLATDYQLPKDAVQQLGTEFIDKPAYNGIYVGGQQAGVFGPVTRSGTNGNLQAPQATHPLITDATAQRMRGIAELSDTGRQRRVQLSLQVLPATGLILPGKLVQVGSGTGSLRGIVRGTAMEWGAPRLRQNLELEVHD